MNAAATKIAAAGRGKLKKLNEKLPGKTPLRGLGHAARSIDTKTELSRSKEFCMIHNSDSWNAHVSYVTCDNGVFFW